MCILRTSLHKLVDNWLISNMYTQMGTKINELYH